MKRRAFTLIELLITTSIFVVVATIATSVFTVTARFQSVTKQNQQNTTEARIAASVLKDAIERTVEYNAQPKMITVDAQSTTSTAFITKASPRLSDGRVDPVTTNWEYYCVETSATGAKRLVRFLATTYVSSGTTGACSAAGFGSLGATTITGPEYLTSEQVDVSWLLIRPLGTAGAALSYAQNAAYDIEVATIYDPTNTAGVERRASESLSSVGQVVVHTIANHYDIQNELNNQF